MDISEPSLRKSKKAQKCPHVQKYRENKAKEEHSKREKCWRSILNQLVFHIKKKKRVHFTLFFSREKKTKKKSKKVKNEKKWDVAKW